MVMALSVKGDVRAVLRHLSDVQRRRVPKAAAQALNRTRQRVHTMSVRSMARRFRIKQKLLRARTSWRTATPGSLVAHIAARWHPMPLIALGKPRRTRRGVSVAGRAVPGGFIATMRSGKRSIFLRDGRARLPITVQRIPIQRDADRIVRVHVTRSGGKLFKREFERQLARIIRR